MTASSNFEHSSVEQFFYRPIQFRLLNYFGYYGTYSSCTLKSNTWRLFFVRVTICSFLSSNLIYWKCEEKCWKFEHNPRNLTSYFILTMRKASDYTIKNRLPNLTPLMGNCVATKNWLLCLFIKPSKVNLLRNLISNAISVYFHIYVKIKFEYHKSISLLIMITKSASQ